MDLTGLFSIFDYFLIMSATSSKQIDYLIEAIEDSLRKDGIKPIGIEGRGGSGWVLIDYGSVVIHIFTEEMREYYSIERLFKDAPALPIEGIG